MECVKLFTTAHNLQRASWDYENHAISLSLSSLIEELYEELELDDHVPPPLPESSRPSSRPPIPSFNSSSNPSQQDTFAIDEDIYEETDDILPTQSPTHAPSPPQVPSLPSRNPPKASTTNLPGPSLPPRNAPASPKLPPRADPGKEIPQDYEMSEAKAKAAVKPPIAPPISANDEDGELYDDVVLGREELVEEEPEELYDDIFTGGQEVEEEELYDDVIAPKGENEGGPITEEFYEDMAPGSTSDSYVAMEKMDEMDDDGELYVDVEESLATSKKKVQDASSPKSSITKKFFRKSSSGTGGSHAAAALTGNISYKAPKKSKFEDRWGVLEGNNLCIYKTSSDKRSQDKISLGDCRLDIGSTEAGAGKFAFSLNKGDKFYHMSLRDKAELNKWVDVLKGIVKYAPVQMEARVEEEDVYEATQDHIANSSNELTFKKGTYIILLERESSDIWYGHFRDDSKNKGRFPVSKVQLVEDLYI